MSITENQKKYKREIYEYYKSLGVCVRCGQDYAMINSVLCPECSAKTADYLSKKYNQIKNDPEFKEKRRIKNKKYQDRKRKEGLCRDCNKPAEKERAYCYECLIKNCKRSRRYRRNKNNGIQRHERPDYGFCYNCGDSVLTGFRVCAKCYEKITNNLVLARNSLGAYINRKNWKKLNSLIFTGEKNDQERIIRNSQTL